jgi:hypothetical protein
MQLDEELLLKTVAAKLTNKPEFAVELYAAIHQGLQNSVRELKHQAADMETVAVMSLHARLFKNQKGYIANLLEKHKDKSFTYFDSLIEELRK